MIINHFLPMTKIVGVDTSTDTVTPEVMLDGIIAVDSTGAQITGTIEMYDGAASGGLAHVVESTEHNGTIPKGATYTVDSTGEVLTEGSTFPEKTEHNDTYTYGDYKYISAGEYGWYVELNTDKNKTSYGTILSSINGSDVTNISYLFVNCESMTTAPAIPSTVTAMTYTFSYCTALTGNVTVNVRTLDECVYCFGYTVQPIFLVGDCSLETKERLAKTATNGNVTYQMIWETLFDGTATDAVPYEGTGVMYYLTLSRALGEDGDYGRVTVDGETIEGILDNMGNMSLAPSAREDTGEDFCFYVNGYHDILITKTAGEHTVKVERRIPYGHYSFNGTTLPPLPALDRSVYPYVYVSQWIVNKRPTPNFFLSACPVELWISSENKFVPRDGSTVTGLVFAVWASDEAWGEPSETTFAPNWEKNKPIWSDTDVYNADGSVYLAASTPVPIYE